MKYLEFKATDTQEFILFYAALNVVSPPGTGSLQLNKAENKIHAKVLSYIESISRPPQDGDVYELPEGMGLYVTLEDTHYDVVKKIIDSFPFNPKFTRELSGKDGDGGLYAIVDTPLKELPALIEVAKEG